MLFDCLPSFNFVPVGFGFEQFWLLMYPSESERLTNLAVISAADDALNILGGPFAVYSHSEICFELPFYREKDLPFQEKTKY